jgi:hypothetical protein
MTEPTLPITDIQMGHMVSCLKKQAGHERDEQALAIALWHEIVMPGDFAIGSDRMPPDVRALLDWTQREACKALGVPEHDFDSGSGAIGFHEERKRSNTLQAAFRVMGEYGIGKDLDPDPDDIEDALQNATDEMLIAEAESRKLIVLDPNEVDRLYDDVWRDPQGTQQQVMAALRRWTGRV